VKNKERKERKMISLFQKTDDIETLVSEFESCTLLRERWDHAAHLTVALWYLARRSRNDATVLIREGIQRYNHACGIIMTKDSGYHETITLFYIWAVGKYLTEVDSGRSILELANGLLRSRYEDRRLALEYYSKDRLMSWEARTGWIEPDLKPLE
jgi:hypothetical protein